MPNRTGNEEEKAYEGQTAGDQAATPQAHARSSATHRRMAQVGRAGLLQLPRGTGEHGQFTSISSAGDPSLATDTALPEPNAPSACGPNVCTREMLASRTARAPSISRATLRRQSSKIRAVCANERMYGSVRGVPGNWYPYRDRRQLILPIHEPSLKSRDLA